LLTALLWIAAGAFAGSYFTLKDQARTRFAFFFLCTLCGNLGLTIAQDLASFYVFFALMSFAAYGLIIHDQSEKALYAGRVYLTMTIIGEVILASAFYYAGLVGSVEETLLFAEIAPALPDHAHGPLILTLAFIGFGVKSGALFLHLWLPLAHPVAPVPASAVLSGAMIKAGLLGWLHFFASGDTLSSELSGWGLALAWLGLTAALYATVSGLAKQDPKTILAYSSVSQMGLMTMALGFALVSGTAVGKQLLLGLLFFALVHGIAKGFLFLGVGLARATACGTVRGFLVLAGLMLAALVLAGLPLTSGAVVKQTLKQGATLLPEVWSGFFTKMLPLTAIGTTLLLAAFVWRVRQDMPPVNKGTGSGMTLSCIGLLGLLVFIVPLAKSIFVVELGLFPQDGQTFMEGLWPIGLGLLAALVLFKSGWGAREWTGLDELILEGIGNSLRRLHQRWKASRFCDPAFGQIDLMAAADRVLQSRWMRTVPDKLEQRLLHWHTAGIIFIFLLMGFILLLFGPLW
jgi:formate hydrogenlyase subunit 3/multisubunit Na+/H+ antiporter MnhD subunit